MSKVLVCGSRGITDRFWVTYAMSKAPLDYDLIIHGGARGVDSLAGEVAQNSGIPVKVVKPDWNKHGKKAGILRNKEMVDEADAVIAIWDGKSRGTKHSIDYAHSKGKPVYVTKVEDEKP